MSRDDDQKKPEPTETPGVSRRRFIGGAIILCGAAGVAVATRRLAMGDVVEPRRPYRGTLRWIGHC
jgi:hypothetical protein